MIEKPIWRLDEINKDQYVMAVTIVNHDQRLEVQDKIEAYGVEVIALEELLGTDPDVVAANREIIAEYHVNQMDDYFEKAEKDEILDIFWNPDSIFYQMFQELNLESVVELACGRGRHVPKYLDRAKHIVLVDILEKNIGYCRRRFQGENKISYYVNNGYDLSELESASQTALFTYDAMVHFELLDIFNYLKETNRILVSGGRALFHHSNNTEDYRITFLTATSGRNYMNKQLFAHLANRAGLKVLEQQVFNWNGVPDLDCLSLLEKP